MPNLPADLPEDWTSNQKISPNGTEVGLSEQHGYNYLMKQVNDTQNEVNNIGTTIEAALEDVAKEASVQEVITSIGDTGDTGGSTVAGTVMSKLNEILEQLGISTTGSTVQEVLEELLNQPKIIRHIQRGTYKTTGAKQYRIDLAGFTNVDKMIVLIDGLQRGEQADRWVIPYISGLTISQLSLSTNEEPNQYSSGSYQVIEFA